MFYTVCHVHCVIVLLETYSHTKCNDFSQNYVQLFKRWVGSDFNDDLVLETFFTVIK